MDRRALLRKTVTLVRRGDPDAFENFYILTVQDTYGKICCLTKEGALQEKLLVGTYVMLYRHAHGLALEEGELEDQIDGEIIRLATKKFGLKEYDLYEEEKYQTLSDEKAAALWMRIEEKLNFHQEERPEKEEKTHTISYVYSFFKVVLTGVAVLVMVFVLIKGWSWFQSSRRGREEEGWLETVTESQIKEEQIVIEEERYTPGWEQGSDGKLYYVKKDGTIPDGALNLGKQVLTFSKEGELVMISDNREVTENPNLSFDEEVRYEARDGDVYKFEKMIDLENSSGKQTKENADSRRQKDQPEELTCVVRNGHVVLADARLGYLWYISKYQVPNSEQIKTTIYRSDLDGENQEEIYSTENTMKTEGFQFTGDWMYYLSDNMLFRRDLKTEKVELLAEKVSNYFAWEDTAYYMKDRTLEGVSEGQDYYGIEAGYRIELDGDTFVLYDAAGNLVEPDQKIEKQVGDRMYRLENGVIRSVRPADRTANGNVYYIDNTGTDRKIYWRSDAGSQGLIRQEGIMADSFCIAGEWLYYSARVTAYGEECDSQIYRVNLQSMELQKVGGAFRGFMRNLYYFDNIQKIFGEYVPSVADVDSIHGKIAVISIGGEMEIVADSEERPNHDGSDFLEMVMADGSRIYCLYHECYYDQASRQFVWELSRPLILEYSSSGAANPNDSGPGELDPVKQSNPES